MKPAAPKGGGGNDARNTTLPSTLTPSAAVQAASPDLPALRERLLSARRRLVERIALEYDSERTYPDTFWVKLLADIQIAIAAVDAVVAEGVT